MKHIMDFPQRIGLVKSSLIDFPKNRKIYSGPDSITINPFQPEAHICVPFSCYVILCASAAVQINQNGR